MCEPVPLHERAERIAEAEELFKSGADAESAGNYSAFGPVECYEFAIQAFSSAAIKFRDIGLGLRARECWNRSAECRRKIIAEQEHYAKADEASRDAIDIIWEGSGDD